MMPGGRKVTAWLHPFLIVGSLSFQLVGLVTINGVSNWADLAVSMGVCQLLEAS